MLDMWFFYNRYRYWFFVFLFFCNLIFLLRCNYIMNKYVMGVSMSLINVIIFECLYCMMINDLEVDEMYDID